MSPDGDVERRSHTSRRYMRQLDFCRHRMCVAVRDYSLFGCRRFDGNASQAYTRGGSGAGRFVTTPAGEAQNRGARIMRRRYDGIGNQNRLSTRSSRAISQLPRQAFPRPSGVQRRIQGLLRTRRLQRHFQAPQHSFRSRHDPHGSTCLGCSPRQAPSVVCQHE